jgi:phosphatidylcholine synthase
VLRFYTDSRASSKINLMSTSAQPYTQTGAQRWLAWSVHAYTATGAIAAFAGALAVIAGDYRAAFLWMAAATAVDATDGVLARLVRVKDMLPGFDGARLDDIVDYLTYVFLPMLLLYHAGDLPRGVGGFVAAGAVLLSSAYGFASLDAKTEDHFFTGFPSYWNIVALYVHVAGLSPGTNAAVVLLFVSLVFVRIGYVYPSRTPFLRGLTVLLGCVWALMVLAIVLSMPGVPRPLWIGSLFFPVYYFMLSLLLHVRGRRA